MRGFTYLPSACFKLRSTQEHKFIQKFEYPKTHRGINFESRRNAEMLESMLDLKNKKVGSYTKRTIDEDGDRDRVSKGWETERVKD